MSLMLALLLVPTIWASHDLSGPYTSLSLEELMAKQGTYEDFQEPKFFAPISNYIGFFLQCRNLSSATFYFLKVASCVRS